MANLELLPVDCVFTLRHLSEAQSERDYGPKGMGDDEDLPITDAAQVRTWHCVIAPLRACKECKNVRERAWFKGHGLTAEEAVRTAIAGMSGHSDYWNSALYLDTLPVPPK